MIQMKRKKDRKKRIVNRDYRIKAYKKMENQTLSFLYCM